jgi:hypothetical protein
MNPNNDQNQSIPSDYLNQIAPQTTKKIDLLGKRSIVIGLICIVIIIIVMTVFSSLSGGTKPTQQLATNLVATKSVSDDATSKIKSTKLQSINSALNLYLTETIRDITPILTNEKININNLSGKSTLSTFNKDILANLEDARLNANYDTIYANEMTYRLSTILNLMQQIIKNTNDKSLNQFLNNDYKNYQPVQKEFADFNETTS